MNYASQFSAIETAVTVEPEVTDKENITPDSFKHIEEYLKAWITDKQFTEPGITLDLLSRQFYTNRKYLSNYFNTVEKKNVP